MADAHYLIEKAVSNGATVSKIRRLDTAETVDELSRMLGGVEITDKVRESAREMKETCHKKEKIKNSKKRTGVSGSGRAVWINNRREKEKRHI